MVVVILSAAADAAGSLAGSGQHLLHDEGTDKLVAGEVQAERRIFFLKGNGRAHGGGSHAGRTDGGPKLLLVAGVMAFAADMRTVIRSALHASVPGGRTRHIVVDGDLCGSRL